jgi:hypothetical protein
MHRSQALIDGKHQVIVHGEAFGDVQDHGHIPPMLTGALVNLQSFGHEPDYIEGIGAGTNSFLLIRENCICMEYNNIVN